MKYFENLLELIEDALDSIDEVQFYQLIENSTKCIKNGGKILASGLGKNVPICEKFAGTMNSLGLDARFLHTNTAIHGDLGMVGENDIVFLLSKSGNTSESVLLAKYLNERKTETWLLTFNEKGILTERMKNKIVIKLKHEGDEWDIVPNNSSTVYLILLQGIAMQISKNRHVAIQDFKRNHPGGGIGEKLRREVK